MGRSSRKKNKAWVKTVAGEAAAGSLRAIGDAQSPQKSPARSSAKDQTYYIAAIASFITFSVYLFSLRNEFVNWDDPVYVSENPHLHAFNSAFFKWAFFDFHAANWHPLTWISHALDYAVWGLNPLGHHLTNILFHAANTFLVVVLATRLAETGKGTSAKYGPASFPDGREILIIGGITGLLFGLHPLHVESVAWIAERKDLLCALFFLLSVLSYMSYMSHKTYRTYSLSLCFFVLALLSKPMAVSLPLVLLILDWYPFKRIQSLKSFGSAFIEKLPFIALSLASSVLTILAQNAGGAMNMMKSLPLSVRLIVAAKSLVSYLWNMLLPINLIPYYPYPGEVSLFSPVYFSAVIMVAGITAACIVLAKKQGLWLATWGTYLVTLIPVIGIVQVGGQAMADRYTYLPSLGPFFIAGLGVAWVSGKAPAVKIKDLFLVVIAVLLFVPLTYLTVKQIRIWKDSFTLWNYVIEKQPMGIHIAYTNRGLALAHLGRLDEAIKDYDRAITLDFSDYKAFANRGTAFDKMGRLDKAIEDFNRAIALNPDFFQAYNDRGSVFKKMGQKDKALEDFDKAIALNPDFDEAYYNRGVTYGEAGLLDKSIDSFDKALAIDPAKVDAYVSRGISYAGIGRYDRALEDFNKAIRLNREHNLAYYNRGNLYFITGKKELAMSDFQKACALGNQGGCDVVKRYGR